MRAATFAMLVAGCSFGTPVSGSDVPGEAGTPIDGTPSIDAQPLDGCTTFSTALDTCAIGTYGAGLSINGNRRYDTNLHILSDDNGGNPTTPTFREVTIGGRPITLLVVESFNLPSLARLRVTGTRAFGVVATGAISITGTLDATDGGAGARMQAACDPIDADGEAGKNNNTGSSGASGGGGGGFGGAGGKGGTGDNDDDQLTGGDGGEARDLAATIIGGCPGGRGGNQQNEGAGGAGGAGGGGVLLVSATSLSVPGIINAGGGGGARGTADNGGGGGGGSGGMIALEAPSLTIAGIVVANGGGGGAGAGNSAGQDGTTGTISTAVTPGGIGNGGGGNGGAGGAGAQRDGQQPGNANAGGGGGGGGAGYITAQGSLNVTGIVSPGFATWPF